MPRESTAARLARQPLDKYGRPLQVSRSSGSPYMGDLNGGNIGVGAEIYLGGQGWVDISSDIYYRDGSTKVSISRGRPNENSGSLPPPQTCSFQLNNRKNQYSPRNPAGPLYGLIGRNTPIRFWRMNNGTRVYRYAGEVPEWPVTADISGNDVYSPINAFGLLRRLQQGNPPVQSAMYRNLINPKRFGENSLVAYWPLEDSSSATQFASAISGAQPMTQATVGVSPASNSSWAASKPIPTMNSGVLLGFIPAYTDTGNVNATVSVLFPSGGITGTKNIMQVYGTGSVRKWVIQADSSGNLYLNAYSISGTQVLSSGPIAFNVNGISGSLGLILSQSGSNINWNIYLAHFETYSYMDGITVYTLTGTLNTQTLGSMTQMVIGDNTGLGTVAMGHCAMGSQTDVFTGTALAMGAAAGEPVFSPDAAVASANYPGGPFSTGRFLRLCQEQNINGVEKYGSTYSGDSVTMGAQTADTLVNQIQQCADSGLNFLYEAEDQVALTLRSRLSLYNQTAALVLDYAQNQLSAQAVPRDDDLFTKNDVTAQRISGSSARQFLNDGSALSISDPPVGVGYYSSSVSLSLGDDTQLNDQAGWRLHMGTVDEPRFPQISVNLRHPTFQNNQDRLNAVLGLDIGDVIEIDNPPAWISYDPIRLVVLGYQETMGAFEHDITFNCAPESSYRVAVLDDPVLSRADTDGSQLSAAMSTLLNTDGQFATGVSSWTPTSCAVSQVGTRGSSNPLPSGGPTGYGAMLTANGGSSVQISQNLMSFPVVAGQTYKISALVYYPSAAHTVMLGIAWRSANNTFISSSTTFTAVTANTWTPISLSFTAVSTAVLANPLVGLGGTPANGDILYVTDIAMWQGDVLVATEDPTKPLWTTSSSDFPFDIGVGGERMTVTGISGSSSPQTFTVARSVNGVVKPQSAGTDVRLWQPMILSM